jgi:hypothetical protein
MAISSSTDLALQVCFGVFGILSTIATLASLHHRDSLGCILLRRWMPVLEEGRSLASMSRALLHTSYSVHLPSHTFLYILP